MDDDLLVDSLAPAASSIYDEYGNVASSTGVILELADDCPTGESIFGLNETANSSYILDSQQKLLGSVNDPTASLPGDGYFHGDGVDNYIEFVNGDTCLPASDTFSLEARMMPSDVDDGDGNTIQRIFAHDSGGNYQMSVWRNTTSNWNPPYNPPTDVASIAFWVYPTDAHGGTSWKPVLTDYDLCPIVDNHWYQVKVVWNSGKVGGIPADIFVDDQGTDGAGAGENWSGYNNCTDSDQSQLPEDRKLVEGDTLVVGSGPITIGANTNNHANNVFQGLIDWITYQEVADYSGVDETPNPAQ